MEEDVRRKLQREIERQGYAGPKSFFLLINHRSGEGSSGAWKGCSNLMNAERVRLYEKTDLAELAWERMKDGEYARAYLEPLILDSVPAYMSNVRTRMGRLSSMISYCL